jgi:hypothetical protein
MLYVKIENDKAVAAQTEYPKEQDGRFNASFQNRNDWKTLARATDVAAQLTEATGTLYIATDAGPHCSPRFDVIDAPVVGAKVSKAFNGDYYPEGEIKSVSKSLKVVITTTGVRFTRRGNTGAWVEGGTWSMVQGHQDRRNREF